MTSRYVWFARFAVLLTFAAALSGSLVLPTLPDADAAPGDCPPARIWVNTPTPTAQLIRYLPSGAQIGPTIPLTRTYNDIAWGGAGGATLYGAWVENVPASPPNPAFSRTRLVTLNATTGAEISSIVVTLNGNPLTISQALSGTPSGNLLLGGGGNIYEVDPATGVATAFATLPGGATIGGDFLGLPGDDVLVLAQASGTGAYYRLKTDGSMVQVGTGPVAWGGAQSGGELFVATQNGDLIRINDVPAGPATTPLPTTTMTDTSLSFYGATSPQDNGSCNVDNFPAYGVEKTASLSVALPGDTISYTIVITNVGTVDYAAGTADVADDLTGVLDDADLVPGSITATSGAATVTGNTLTWTGALPVGATVTVTYQVVVDNPPTGSWELANSVRGLGAQAVCTKVCATFTPIRVDGRAPGACPPATIWMNTTAGGSNTNQLSRYGLDGTQIGASVPLAAAYTDLAWSPDGSTLYGMKTPNILDQINPTTGAIIQSRSISGLPGGGATLGHSLVALPDNTLLIDYGANPNKYLYKVTITGLTTAAATLYAPSPIPSPSTVAADIVPLTGGDVLVFAKNGASPSPALTSLFRVSPTGVWTQIGTVPVTAFGAARTAGDVYLVTGLGVVWRLNGVPTTASTAPIPITQAFDAPLTSWNGASSTQDNSDPNEVCAAESDMRYSVAKAAPSTVTAGDLTTYTVTVTNTGAVPYPASYAGFRDDLTDVLDDGTLVPGSITASAGSAALTGNTLNWSGPLAANGTVTVTYQVRAAFPGAGGNRSLVNVVSANGVGGTCVSLAACTTTTSIRSFAVNKSTSIGVAAPGDTVTYTLRVTNTDSTPWGPGEATIVDDLSDVLDDASIDPATVQATAGTATLTGTTLTWSGPLTAGGADDVVTITYVARVKEQPTDGGALINAVTPGSGGGCATASDCTTTTTTAIKLFGVTKTVAPTGQAAPGDPVTYTITVRNTGSAPWGPGQATIVDNLSDVLDDASIDPGTIRATAGTATLTGTTLNWSGPLTAAGPGNVVTITYVANIHRGPATGNDNLINTVAEPEGGNCDGPCRTATSLVRAPIPPTQPSDPEALPNTGTPVTWWTLPLALALLLLGAAAVWGARRRS